MKTRRNIAGMEIDEEHFRIAEGQVRGMYAGPRQAEKEELEKLAEAALAAMGPQYPAPFAEIIRKGEQRNGHEEQ